MSEPTATEVECIDRMDEAALRAMVHHQSRLLARLLADRERHLLSVEAAFRQRHNDQQERIHQLEQQLRRQEA